MRLEPDANRYVTEKAFQATVVESAKLFQWDVKYTWNSIHSPAGLPDLILIRKPLVVFAELKTATGKVSQAQQDTLDELYQCTRVETHLWRPDDFPDILEVLR